MAKVKIEHQNIIFCEGMDANMFLIWYLNSQALSGNPIFANDIQVMMGRKVRYSYPFFFSFSTSKIPQIPEFVPILPV